jgi:hypothetical protein
MVGTCSKQDMRNARKFRAEILIETDQWRDYGKEGNIRIDPVGSRSADWIQLVYNGAQWRVILNAVWTFGFIKREFLDHIDPIAPQKKSTQRSLLRYYKIIKVLQIKTVDTPYRPPGTFYWRNFLFTLEQARKVLRCRGIALLFLKPRRSIGVGGQRHAPAALPLGERQSNHRTWGWVDRRVSIDGFGKSLTTGIWSPDRLAHS